MPLTLVPDAISMAPPVLAESSTRPARRIDLGPRRSESGATREVDPGESAFLARLRRGDDAAYETLVRTHGPRMLAVARGYLPTLEDAEDALQSAFLLVVRFLPRFQGACRLSTWLHRIVVNCSLMRIRSLRRHPETRLNVSAYEDGSVAELAAHVRSSVADEVVERETHDRLLRAVARLPDRVRAAVRLLDVDGLTLAEAAVLLDRSLTALKADVHRGRTALFGLLAPSDEFPTPGVRRR